VVCKNKIIKLNINTIILQEITEKEILIINPSGKEIKLVKNNEVKQISVPKISLFKIISGENIKLATDEFELELRDNTVENVTSVIVFPRFL